MVKIRQISRIKRKITKQGTKIQMGKPIKNLLVKMDPLNSKHLSAVTLNVNGIGLKNKRDKTLKTLLDYDADVLFLQETHAPRIKEWQGVSYCSYGSNKSAGSAVLFRKGLILEIEEQSSDFDGRIASVKAVCFGQRFNFVSAYAPNNPAAKRLFFQKNSQSTCQ